METRRDRGCLAGVVALVAAAGPSTSHQQGAGRAKVERPGGGAVQVAVDRRGALTVAGEQMRRLRAKPAENGMVCLEFAGSAPQQLPAGHRDGDGHDHSLEAAIPTRLWVGRRKDGSVYLPRMSGGPGGGSFPGPPGTVYRLRGAEGRIILTALSAPEKSRRPSAPSSERSR